MTPDELCKQEIKEVYLIEFGSDKETFSLGKNGVIQIAPHPASGDGDRWFYDVYIKDGDIVRVFNPTVVTYRMKVKS